MNVESGNRPVETQPVEVQFEDLAKRLRTAFNRGHWRKEEELHYEIFDLFVDNDTDTESDKHYRMENVKKMLEQWGHNPDALIASWMESDPDRSNGAINSLIGANFFNMATLECLRPGSTKKLSEGFGIRNYGRIPDPETRNHDSLILDQIDGMQDTKKPYGLYAISTNDHNGAFNHIYSLLTRNAGFDYYPVFKEAGLNERIIETDSKDNFFEMLRKMDSVYGQEGNKISFLIVSAHGNPNVISFGDSAIIKEDTLKQDFRDLGNLFAPNATMIIDACSTGNIDGIAQAISKVWGITVIAPDGDTSMEKFSIINVNNKFDFQVGYRNAQARYFRDGVELSPLDRIRNYLL